ncbi:MAG: hypothetical protein EOP83_00785 [Verrucomicrobiaceae bacterium]|nr:MAG: hypothetical protein EOP83_00785 [Verrucomicrobiaceae bacterium]
MPTPNETSFKVFYSWQSDLPDVVNLKLIRNALNQAANKINSDHELGLHVMTDEATREVPGSPNIAESIFSKIRQADVFVCDLTKVAEIVSTTGKARIYCNPNVAIELGYAVRVLGWGRIIIVFNTSYGSIPEDLPFDARGHRTSAYQCKAEVDERGRPGAACIAQISSATGSLRATLTDALELIARESPKRPHEAEATDPQIIRRKRDLEQLKEVFYWINLNMIDQFIFRLGSYGRTSFAPMDFVGFLGAVLDSSKFHLYDSILRDLIFGFHSAWGQCLSRSHFMDLTPNGKELHFHTPLDFFKSEAQEDAYNFTVAQAKPLREKLNELLAYIREHFIEIDLDESGMEAVKKYSRDVEE